MIDHFIERIVDNLRKTQYQPVKDRQIRDAQEVHFAKDFKHADIAGGYRKQQVREAKKES